MGAAWLDRVVQLDIRELGAADDTLLFLGGQRVPPGQIVQVLLHDDIAAAGERRVLVADERCIVDGSARGILRSVDKAEEIAGIEITKAVHLIDRRHGGTEPGHDLRRQLEAQIQALGTDVEQQVAGRRDGMA